MANYTGAILAGCLAATPTGQGNITTDPESRTYNPGSLYDPLPMLSGADIGQQVITVQPQAAKSGALMTGFADDYYNRIHYSDTAFDLGNVITNVTRTISIWNAYLSAKTLNSITEVGTEGINLNQPVISPATFHGLQEQTYQLEVTTDGPPIIDASYTFNWTAANGATLTITGSRISAWVWRPDWSRAIIERLAWLTDVQRAYDGSEQRIRTRATPRRALEFQYMIVDGHDRRKFDAALWDWQSRVWSLPIWTDGQTLSAPLTAGDQLITATTTDYDYSVGGYAILLNQDTLDSEVVEISTVAAGQIGALRPLTNNWPAGTWIYPAKSARLSNNHKLTRFERNTAYAIATFQFTDSSAWAKATEIDTYRGYPIFNGQHNWNDTPTETFSRDTVTIDNATGKWSIDDKTGRPDTSINHQWEASSRAEIAALRSWLYSRQGRLTMFWRPTGTEDLEVKADISAVSANIDIEWIGATKFYKQDRNRRDIRIEANDGTVYYRRIIGSVEVDATTERLSIDAALGTDYLLGTIKSVQFMVLRRLGADNLELAWWTGEIATCKFNMVSVNNDV